jgi:hypothetical protein
MSCPRGLVVVPWLLSSCILFRVAPSLAGEEAAASTSSGEASSAAQVVHAEGVDPLRATPVQSEQAQARFVRGKGLYDEARYQEALEEFAASRSIVASPNARLYRARCLVQLGQHVEAYNEYGRTMVQALELAKQEVRYARTAEAATKERTEIEHQLAFVRVNVHGATPQTRLFVNGEEIRRVAWGEPVPTAPGVVKVELLTPEHAPQQQATEIAAGSSKEFVLEVQAANAAPVDAVKAIDASAVPVVNDAKAEPSLLPYAYVSAGVGALGLGAFAVFGTMSRQTYTDLEARCTDGSCPPAEAKRIEQGRDQQLFANVGLAVAAVGLGTAVTLWIADSGGGPEASQGNTAVLLGPQGASLWGRW